jgi:hypothetical protein
MTRDIGSAVFSSVSDVVGIRGKDSRINLGEELPWSMEV